MRRVVLLVVAALALAGTLVSTATATASAGYTVHGDTVRIGHARFEVLSPTLVRVEYASDDRFEDRPTMTVPRRTAPKVAFTTTQADGVLRIRTARITLAYRPSGAPDATNLTISGQDISTGHPSFPAATTYHQPPLKNASLTPAYVQTDPAYRLPTTGNLGGWYRALDGADGPVRLHDGLLDRRGWYLLDDTQTVVTTTAEPGYVPRDLTDRTYRDGYLFGYGHDYARGLQDLSDLVGNAPLLPRNAFAPWWSKYAADPQSSYAPLVARFAKAGIDLGVIDVDTDAKAPHVWNGWGWSKKLFPDPKAFTSWAHQRGIDIGFNIHPSIAIDDPAFVRANTTAGGIAVLGGLREDLWRCRAITLGTDLGLTGLSGLSGVPDLSHATGLGTLDCRVFDWGKAGNQAAYLALHQPFTDAGVDLYWLDYCCDESSASGVGAADPWINRLYAASARARGSRWPVLSRVGSALADVDTGGPGIWAERRDTIHFTGDAASTWATLRFETAFTAAEGNVGLPYVSHDIGGYLGKHLPDDLYVRWVQAGTFAPIMRLHSDHGDRLPWQYGAAASKIAARFLRLRDQLVPYLYTVAHQAVSTGLPMTRALYLQWPDRAAAYRHPGEYLLGNDLLVAPVTSPSSRVTLWVPPGRWTDFFTGHTYVGPAVHTVSVPLSRSIVLRRAGSILPLQPSPRRGLSLPPTSLTLDLAPGRKGSFVLYDDAGDGLGYLHGQSATTRITQTRHGKTLTVRIGAAHGSYPGMPAKRTWTIKAHVPKPRVVAVDGHVLPPSYWNWGHGAVSILLSMLSSHERHTVRALVSSG